MVSLIILGVVITVILLLVLLVVYAISIKIELFIKNNNENKYTHIHETPEFQAGVNHGFSLIQICLYKMWSEQDILDFDSINDNIKNNLLTITKNDQSFQDWHKKYKEYINDKNTGEN